MELGSEGGLATSLSLLRAMGPGCSSVERFRAEGGQGRSRGPALPASQCFQQFLRATHSKIHAGSRPLWDGKYGPVLLSETLLGAPFSDGAHSVLLFGLLLIPAAHAPQESPSSF